MSVRNASSSLYLNIIDAQNWSVMSVNSGVTKDVVVEGVALQGEEH